jgi:hypothetical protein
VLSLSLLLLRLQKALPPLPFASRTCVRSAHLFFLFLKKNKKKTGALGSQLSPMELRQLKVMMMIVSKET